MAVVHNLAQPPVPNAAANNLIYGAISDDNDGYSSIDRRQKIAKEEQVQYQAHRHSKVLSSAV